MLTRYTEKNKYGGFTWHIKLDSLFHIFINGTKDNFFVIDFKEWKWLSYKTHFSFVSNKDLVSTIRSAYDQVFNFFQHHKDYVWSEQEKNKKLSLTLDLLKKLPDPANIYHSNTQKLTKVSKIKLMRGVSLDDNFISLTTCEMIFQKYGKPNGTVNHNNYSLELKYPELGMSFCYKLNDYIKIIYLMMATGEVPCETETGLTFDSSLTMKQVLAHYGVGKPSVSDDSDEAYMRYPGIIFYANKNDFSHLPADEIYINKIATLEL